MRDAGGKQAERGEFFGLDHLFFETNALGDVVERIKRPSRAPLLPTSGAMEAFTTR